MDPFRVKETSDGFVHVLRITFLRLPGFCDQITPAGSAVYDSFPW